MNLETTLREMVASANRRIAADETLRQKLNAFAGRRIVLEVHGDTRYAISLEGGSLRITRGDDIKPAPKDPFLTAPRESVERFLVSGQVNLTDLALVKHKNIGWEEIKLARTLVRAHAPRLLEPAPVKGRKKERP